MTFAVFSRCLGIGAVTGLRTTAGIADLVRSGTGANVMRVLELGELIGDKLPITPSRLQPPALLARATMGGVCGRLIARREEASIPLGIAAGVAGALLGAFAGARYRGLAERAGIPDWPLALLEDGLAVWGARKAAGA